MDSLKEAKKKLEVEIGKMKELLLPENEMADAELRRRKFHNAIEDLKGSIRVFCRVRPLSTWELEQGDESIIDQVDCMTVSVTNKEQSTATPFAFDAVFMT